MAARGVPTQDPRLDGFGDYDHKPLKRFLREILADVPGHRPDFLWGGGPSWELMSSLPPKLLVFISPPRGTLLRAKDRSGRTQVRSPGKPWSGCPLQLAAGWG